MKEVVETNAKLVAKELLVRSPIITDAVNRGVLRIVPAYYELGSGRVNFLD